MLTLRDSLMAMATVAAYFVAYSFFTFGHDFFLYNFAYYFNKIFCNGKPPILFEINCLRIGILMGWIHAEIKQARQGGRNVRKEIDDLARGMKTRSRHSVSLRFVQGDVHSRAGGDHRHRRENSRAVSSARRCISPQMLARCTF
ncbi:hypothetical protein PMAYCL1PPCAC_27456, partial [Pristionchus mayeri]